MDMGCLLKILWFPLILQIYYVVVCPNGTTLVPDSAYPISYLFVSALCLQLMFYEKSVVIAVDTVVLSTK
jgi:hypothetical protein